MVAANGISVNVRMLPLFTPSLGAQMTQPLLSLSRSRVTPFKLPHSGNCKSPCNNRHRLRQTDKTRHMTHRSFIRRALALQYSASRHSWTRYKWVNSSTTVAAQRKLAIHKSCPERRVSSPWTLSDYSYAIAFIELCILKLSQRAVLQCCHCYNCTVTLAGVPPSEPLWYTKITTWNFAK